MALLRFTVVSFDPCLTLPTTLLQHTVVTTEVPLKLAGHFEK